MLKRLLHQCALFLITCVSIIMSFIALNVLLDYLPWWAILPIFWVGVWLIAIGITRRYFALRVAEQHPGTFWPNSYSPFVLMWLGVSLCFVGIGGCGGPGPVY